MRQLPLDEILPYRRRSIAQSKYFIMCGCSLILLASAFKSIHYHYDAVHLSVMLLLQIYLFFANINTLDLARPIPMRIS